MSSVFAALFLQMHRWHSLEVVSNTLKPLCTALQLLSGHTLTQSGSGAPCLEFIKLKRSNDYYNAHSQQFAPPMELDNIPFAALIGGSDQDVREQDQDIPAQVPAPFFPLPKLCYVDLFGVPLNWTGFLHVLGADHRIQSLELSHHNARLKPMFDQFSAILTACPLLQRLVIRASGPILHQPFHHDAAISLPMLEELHLGYIDTSSLDVLLSCLDATNLVALSIKDVIAVDPRPPGRDAGRLLSYCASGFSEHPSAVSRTSMPFPKIQRLSLHRVHATVTAFSIFIPAFSRLHHLSLLRTPNALAALLLDTDTTMPCPALTSILVSPIMQPEVLKLKQRKSICLVLPGDVEQASPSIPAETAYGGCYHDINIWDGWTG
ncbi:hypothetical protein BDR05DRAFT_948400 [Suillus weaverae]|nr:hypothetical protein BDR05DRAFT_948400 [Suillus weaverae]